MALRMVAVIPAWLIRCRTAADMRIHQLAIVLLAGALLAACATDPGVEDDGDTSSTEQDLSGNQHAAFNYFVARGLTKRQSAGIVGNLIQESSVIPTSVQYGGGP